jgi:hypothetical protein
MSNAMYLVEYWDTDQRCRTVEMQFSDTVVIRGDDYMRTVAALNLAHKKHGFSKVRKIYPKPTSNK